MATSVQSGEEAAAHTATDQWQSFEMRMRRRRVERLLARASEAFDAGREDTAREAIAEIEQLSRLEPRLPELRARLDSMSAAAPLPPAVATVVTTDTEPVSPPRIADEITSSVHGPSIAVEPPTPLLGERPAQAATFSVTPTISPDDLVLDLPLVLEEPPANVDPIPAETEKRRGIGLAFAAAALLACGALGWFLGPNLTTIVQTRVDGPAQPSATPGIANEPASPPADEPKPTEPLAPVQVAVDEIPANPTVETPAEPIAPTTAQPPLSQTSTVERAANEPRADIPIPAATRTEVPSPPEAPPPAPISTPPHASGAALEKPGPVPVLAENTPKPTTPSSPAINNEPVAPAAAVPPPPSPAAATAAPRDEEKIRVVLDHYAAAYSRLDADAASAIFPGVDRRALARAFDGLSSQTVNLGSCDVRVAIESAIVDCAGSATWTPKIGGGSRTEARRWQFRLRNESGDWQMVAAKVR